MKEDYQKGRGAQKNTANRFSKTFYEFEPTDHEDERINAPSTRIYKESPKKIISSNKSPDIPFNYSINPYQGCEHGCIYCYARPTHEYWGFSAGWDFESKIVVKENAARLLENQFLSKNWKPTPIMLSGNTDCYQPLEKKLEITRSLLKVFMKYGNPVGIITKNSLILRDLDILKDLAKEGLVHVVISITTLDENLRRLMEPRTASGKKKLETIQQLTSAGIPVGVMTAPIIPALNSPEIPEILKQSSAQGALMAGFTLVRLNGALETLFKDWLEKNFPDKADKVWNQIMDIHGGNPGDSRFGTRMRGEGKIAESITQLFKISRARYFKNKKLPPFNLDRFRKGGNLTLF
ncbi:PA0069 family radical SAM protein [Flexithrix dorotheae]|uniref:PA0069 family radical SAM protein n=1 Tax=Flexithrix dorotheae TaxID=70993 RepID=UPI00035E0049|nr:PA0069 family radical SAM protein [Flexithrix dorotheae]